MSKKDQKRRETTRRQKEQRKANLAAADESAEEVVDEAGDAAPEDEAAAIKRRAEQKREYDKRKRAQARGGQPLTPYFWGGGIAAAIAVAVVGGFLLLGGGGGDDDGPDATPIVTPDSRISGLPIDVTFAIDADDNGQNVNPRFIPNAISANAGQVVEIVLTNVGSVAHNLRLAGIDDEYDTRDDWLTNPATLFAGDTGTVVVKLDDPGVYAFRCDFHATLQTGTFTVR
jgi:plastocyanin